MCGEQHFSAGILRCIRGSPPRVRGTASSGTFTPASNRITPACAGNSILLALQNSLAKDHPRVCGEQENIRGQHGKGLGSPPRVRGTANAAHCFHVAGRITPACAGNRPPPWAENGGRKDHPRVCGEQSNLISPVSMVQGSPPRVRGTDHALAQNAMLDRITPACAGNS